MSAAFQLVQHFYDKHPGRVPLSVAFGMGLREILPFVFADDTGRNLGIMALESVADENMAVVQLFHVSAFRPRRGAGTVMLRALCAEADRRQVIVTLSAVSMDNGRDPQISNDDLAAWYRRFGFEGEGRMTREPRD